MMYRHSLTPGREEDTKKPTDTRCVIMTVNGLVQAEEEATVHMKGLHIFVSVTLVEESAVSSLEMMCEEMATPTLGKNPRTTFVNKRRSVHQRSIGCSCTNGRWDQTLR